MDKEHVIATRKMWKDYPNTQYWIDIISHPKEHIFADNNGEIFTDTEYLKAVESLKYILVGEEI